MAEDGAQLFPQEILGFQNGILLENLCLSLLLENANSNDMNMSSDDQYSSTKHICPELSARWPLPGTAVRARPLARSPCPHCRGGKA